MYLKKLVSNIGLSQYYQLPINVRLTRYLGWEALRKYIILLGLVFYFLKKGEREKIINSLCHVHWLRMPLDIFGIIKIKIFIGIFLHYYEKLLMAYKPLPQLKRYMVQRLHCTNKLQLDRLMEKGMGAILVTGHFGAVEFLPMALSIQGYKTAMIVKFKTKQLKEELLKQAVPLNIQLIDAEEPMVAIKVLKAIKKGRLLITQCDEFNQWMPHQDKTIDVFGLAKPLDKTLDFFYRKAKVPAFLSLMKREINGRYTLCIDQLADGREAASLSGRAWSKMEERVIEYPHLWYQWKSLASFILPIPDQINKNENKKGHYSSAEHTLQPAHIA